VSSLREAQSQARFVSMTSLKSKRLRLLGFRMIAVLDMAYSSPKASAICVTALPTDPSIAGASTVLLH